MFLIWVILNNYIRPQDRRCGLAKLGIFFQEASIAEALFHELPEIKDELGGTKNNFSETL